MSARICIYKVNVIGMNIKVSGDGIIVYSIYAEDDTNKYIIYLTNTSILNDENHYEGNVINVETIREFPVNMEYYVKRDLNPHIILDLSQEYFQCTYFEYFQSGYVHMDCFDKAQ
jgi:hypothetical protein